VYGNIIPAGYKLQTITSNETSSCGGKVQRVVGMYKVGEGMGMKEGPKLLNNVGISALHEIPTGSRRKLHLDLK
jgi:hypothetical protein